MATSEITVDSVALTRFVERLEGIEEERAELAASAKTTYEEIKASGMSVETVRVMVKERRLDAETRENQYKIRDSYRRALNLYAYADTPLGEAAIDAAVKAADRPRPFAEQPIKTSRRGRPRKNGNPDPFAAARHHLEGEPPS